MAPEQADKNVNRPDDFTNCTEDKPENRKKSHGNFSNAERKKNDFLAFAPHKKRSPERSS